MATSRRIKWTNFWTNLKYDVNSVEHENKNAKSSQNKKKDCVGHLKKKQMLTNLNVNSEGKNR